MSIYGALKLQSVINSALILENPNDSMKIGTITLKTGECQKGDHEIKSLGVYCVREMLVAQ